MTQGYKGLQIPEYPDPADGPMAFQLFVDSGPIPRFADASARDIAIPTPVNGQVVYREDIARIEAFVAGSWAPTALPLAGGTMQGAINMAGNMIQNLPNPTGSGQPVPLNFADSRYVNATEAIPWTKISQVPNADEEQSGVTKVIDRLDSTLVRHALSANMGKQLNDNKLNKTNPVGSGTLSIWQVELQNGWGLDDTGGGTPNLAVTFNNNPQYAFYTAMFRPSDDGVSDLGATSFAWRNLYYTGSLVKASSAALKTDIEAYDFDALNIVASVPPKRFKWRSTLVEDVGFIAEDMPPPIRRTQDGVNHLIPDQMIVTLWQAVRQLAARVEALET